MGTLTMAKILKLFTKEIFFKNFLKNLFIEKATKTQKQTKKKWLH